MIRYYVQVYDKEKKVAGHDLENCEYKKYRRWDSYKGYIFVDDGEDIDKLEDAMSDDENVVFYTSGVKLKHKRIT